MFLQVRRFGSDVGIFPEIEETIPDERCVYGTGMFMYRAHGKLLFFATHFMAMCTPYLFNSVRRRHGYTVWHFFEVRSSKKAKKDKNIQRLSSLEGHLSYITRSYCRITLSLEINSCAWHVTVKGHKIIENEYE